MKHLCLRAALLCLFAVIASACSTEERASNILGQKLMLDIRYYCTDGTPAMECNTPVTTLLPEIADIIRQGRIGGVILFAENLQSTAQIVELTYALQKVAKDAGLPPLFIAIDQEGGRVARLPDSVATRFVGNMAIGATYPVHQTEFASKVNQGIASSIRQLGFNVNFAPTVDVNVNADNPVINVRSYGESAPLVAELGGAAVAALQRENILSALKHFPGHGDTHVDSHTGLPRVEHDMNTIEEVDLLPFSFAISQGQPPAMIMTAHIQYPRLDDSEFIGKDGQPTLVPATLSHKILTGLLRNKMGYEGIIVTDALDMAGIAHYVDHRDAVIRTFNAGADIALMPYAIRNPATIKEFWQLYQQWLDAMEAGELESDAMKASAQRIVEAKRHYNIADYIAQPLSTRLEQALSTLPYAENQQLEQALAAAALTEVYNHDVIPLKGKVMTLVMPDQARCEAMSAALLQRKGELQLQCVALTDISSNSQIPDLTSADTLIVGDITPQHSLAEMGGMADLSTWRNRPDKTTQSQWLNRVFIHAKAEGVNSVFVALRAPYIISEYRELADAAVATFGYNVTVSAEAQNEMSKVSGAVFNALADGLLGLAPMPGQSPVTIE